MYSLIGVALLAQVVILPDASQTRESETSRQEAYNQEAYAMNWQVAKLANQVYCDTVKNGTNKTPQEILNSAPMYKMANVTWRKDLECFANQEFIGTALEVRTVTQLLNQYLDRHRFEIENPTPAEVIGYAAEAKIIDKEYVWYLITAVATFDVAYNATSKAFESKNVKLPNQKPKQRSGIEESK